MKAHDVIHVADIAHQVVLYLLVCEDGLLVPHLIYKLHEEQIFKILRVRLEAITIEYFSS